ncbi:MAG: hypothetical protein JNG86_00340, partial [Verrucomicrobiaceae bacterium]|nr:hypothetical protein [Verrucomicrobiaceae bacterium]
MNADAADSTASLETQMGDDHLDGADVCPACPACLAELTDGCNFCPACAAPVSPTAAICPFERVLAEGYIYRQAVSSPRSLVVIVGIWAVFLLLFLTGLAMVSYEFLVGETDMLYRLEGSFLVLVSGLG